MRTLGCNELKELIDSPENEIILEVLDQSEFEKSHLPDAISVPYDDDFDARVLEAVPDKSLTVVVYCQNRHSRKSHPYPQRNQRGRSGRRASGCTSSLQHGPKRAARLGRR